MITKVIIENFQSHKKTEVEFVAGTNVIIGESDTGKSAIFRAINWVVTNRPLGDSFRSEWGGDTRVALYTSEGHVVERIRTPSRNEYIIDGQVLKAFGADPPDEIIEILQIDAFNIQEQFEPPFLLSNTPGEVARILNKAASIDDIDKAISGLKSSLNRINTDIAYNEKQLKTFTAEMKAYENLPEIETRVKRVEELEEESGVIADQIADLQRLSARVRWVEEALLETNHIPQVLTRLEESENRYSDYQTQEIQHQKLCRIATRIKDIEEELEQTKDVEKALLRAGQVDGKITSLKESREKGIILRRLVDNLRRTSSSIAQLDIEIERLSKEYERIAPETCPLCGAKMRKEDSE